MLESSEKYIKLCENLISDLALLIPTGHALYKVFDELRQDFKTINASSPDMVKLRCIHIKLCELKKKLIPAIKYITEIVEVEKYRDCGDLEQQNANLLQIIDNLKRKLDETYEMFDNEMSNLPDENKTEVGKLKEEIENLRKELEDLNELNNRDIKINKKLVEIIEGIKKESKKLSDEVKEQKNNADILEKGYSIDIKQLTDDLTKARKFIADLNAKNMVLNAKNRDLNAENRDLNAENKNLAGQLANLTEMNNKIKNSNLELEQKNAEIQIKESENNTKINNLEIKLKKIETGSDYDSEIDKTGYDSDADKSLQQYKELLAKNTKLIEENKKLLKYKEELEETHEEATEYNQLLEEYEINEKQLELNIERVEFLNSEINRLRDQTAKIINLEKKIESTQIISLLFKNIMFIYDELNYFDEFSRIKPNNLRDNYESTPKEIRQVDASKLSNNIVVLYNTYAEYFTKIELSFIILFFNYIEKLLLRKTGRFGTSVKIDLEYKKVVSAFSSTLLFIYKSIIHRNLYKNSNENENNEIIERINNFTYHLSKYLKISNQATNARNTSHDKLIDGTLSHDKAHAKSLDGKMMMTSLTNERKRYCANLPKKLKELYDIGLQTRPNTPLNFHSPKNSQISSSSEGIYTNHDGSYSDSPKSSISSGEFESIGRNGSYNYNAHLKLSPEQEDNSSDKSDDGIGIFSEHEQEKMNAADLLSNKNRMNLSSMQSTELNNMNHTHTPPTKLSKNTNFLNAEADSKPPYSILSGEDGSTTKSTKPIGYFQSIKNIFVNTDRKNDNNGSSSNQTGINSNPTTKDLSSQQNTPFKTIKTTPRALNYPYAFEYDQSDYILMNDPDHDSDPDKKSEYFGGGVLGGCVMLLNNAVAVLMIMCVLLIMYIIYLYYTNYKNYNTQNNKPQNNYNPYDIMY